MVSICGVGKSPQEDPLLKVSSNGQLLATPSVVVFLSDKTFLPLCLLSCSDFYFVNKSQYKYVKTSWKA